PALTSHEHSPTRRSSDLVARPMAQGQAMIRTATALTSAKVSAGAGPKKSQTRKVTAATASTAGTNQAVTLSARAWIGSFAPWARSEEHTSELQSRFDLVC